MQTYRLTRNVFDRVLGGVCGGIGRYLSVSGWWVRAAFVALTLTSLAFGILLYLLLWLIIPIQTLAEVPPILRPGQTRPPRYARPETMLLLGAGSVLVGIVVLTQSTGVLQGVRGDILAPLMLLLIGLALLSKHLRGVA
jgi:phage shock protein C